MKFSIILAFDNEFELINNFFENLIRTTDISAGEIILVSDECRDYHAISYVREKIKNHGNIKLIELQKKSGYSIANNIGVQNSNGDILVFINSDVLPEYGSLNLLVDFLDSHSDIGAVQGCLIYSQNNLVQSTGHLFIGYNNRHIYAGCESNSEFIRQSGERQALTTAFCAVRRECFFQNGMFDEIYYNAYEGMELTLKISQSRKKCYYLSDAKAYHIVGGSRNNIVFNNSLSGHIFWDRWHQKIATDIHKYITPQITEAILNNTYFLVNASSILGWDEVLHDLNFNISGSIELKDRYLSVIDLYRNMPFSALDYPSPYLFLVDKLSYIKGNYNWVKNRNNSHDIVIDSHALLRSLNSLILGEIS